jgi:hypothetical protein
MSKNTTLRARGDAVAVNLQADGKPVGQIWRRPYVIHLGGCECSYVRFNYEWWMLEAGNVVELDMLSRNAYKEHPRRFNTIGRV